MKPKNRYDEIGKSPEGLSVAAATDSAGPQVIVQGTDSNGKKWHLLSRSLKDHEAAIELGKQVVAKGTTACSGWRNLLDESPSDGLFSLMFDVFQQNQKRQSS